MRVDRAILSSLTQRRTLLTRRDVRARWIHREIWFALALIAPALLVVLGVYLYPAIVTLVFSFSRVNVRTFSVEEITGLQHYLTLFRDPALRVIALRTVYFGGMIALISTSLALPIALLLNQHFWGRGVIRVVVFLPWAVPPVVSGVLWGQMFHAEHGFINGLIRNLGGSGDIIWLGNSSLALHAIIVAEVWRSIPLATLFLLAALQTLPDSVYEAAAIDGANPWQSFRHITVPLILPVLVPVITFQFIWAMKIFDIIVVLTRGGPAMSTTTLNYLVYQQAFQFFRFDQAAATAYVLTLLTLLVIMLLGYLHWRRSLRAGEVQT
jgi:multiple sugar transport system permease protein